MSTLPSSAFETGQLTLAPSAASLKAASFDKTDAGFRLTKITVRVRGDVPGVDEAAFKEAADGARVNCPVSKALEGNVDITVDASLA